MLNKQLSIQSKCRFSFSIINSTASPMSSHTVCAGNLCELFFPTAFQCQHHQPNCLVIGETQDDTQIGHMEKGGDGHHAQHHSQFQHKREQGDFYAAVSALSFAKQIGENRKLIQNLDGGTAGITDTC